LGNTLKLSFSVTLKSDWGWGSEIGVSSSIVLYIVRNGHTPRTRNSRRAAGRKLWEIKKCFIYE